MIPATLIETVAMTAHAAIREMGIAAGEVDGPTWQILPGERKIQYRRAAQAAIEEQAAAAGDPLLERLARSAYERWRKEQANVALGSVMQPDWDCLAHASQLHWRMVGAIARVTIMGTAAARGVQREQVNS